MDLENKIKEIVLGIKKNLDTKIGKKFNPYDLMYYGNYPTVFEMETKDKPNKYLKYQIIGYVRGRNRGKIEINLKDKSLDNEVMSYIIKNGLKYDVNEGIEEKTYIIKLLDS